MKRVLGLVVILSLVLVSCSGGGELDQFVETFNQRAGSEGVAELIPDEFGKIEKDDGEVWRELYESEKYSIAANYKTKTSLSGYSISIDSGEPFAEQQGEGYKASLLIARSIGLNVSDYAKNFGKALRTDIHTYSEDGYEVKFVYIGHDSTIPTSILVSFDKK